MRLGRLVFLVASTLAGAAPVVAQKSTPISVTRGEFSVSPYGGYLISQEFFEGPLNTTLGVNAAPVYGLQGSLPLSPAGSLVGTVGYAAGDLEVGLPILGGIDLGNSSTWLFDLSVELRGSPGMLGLGRIVPLAQLGGGAVHRRLSVYGLDAKSTDFTVSAGVGADLPITSNIAIRLLARDYLGKADFGTLGPLVAKTQDIHAVTLSTGLRIGF